MAGAPQDDDTFELYDLSIDVVLRPGGAFVCGHALGHAFSVIGEDIVFDGVARFSMYSLAGLLPLLPAKQRSTDANDWMTSETDIACVDPNCGAVFRITRVGRSGFSHAEAISPR
jgi:uncharacterized repeat protein (TIGR04076 family)